MDNIPKCRITKHAEERIHEHLPVLEGYGIPRDYLYNAILRACRDAQSFHAKNKYNIKCFVIPAHRHFYLVMIYRIDEVTNEVIIITVILTSDRRIIDRKCGGYAEILTLA